jgi:hypothetical protein
MSQETPTGVSCRLCQQPIYRWTNDFQQRVHCGCTVWISPLDADGSDEIDIAIWSTVVNTARKGIKQWLKRS